MFTRLILERFTVFDHADFVWSPGINVLVGDNGVGKTHIMKVLYALQSCAPEAASFEKKLIAIFRPKHGAVTRLIRRCEKESGCEAFIAASFAGDKKIRIDFSPLQAHGEWPEKAGSVYIPVKEMLSFVPGLVSLYEQGALQFEEIYYDILKQAYQAPDATPLLPEAEAVLAQIDLAVGGELVLEGEGFFLRRPTETLEMGLVAEGHRKLALLGKLIRNGLLRPGSCLFWDEPEANFNPSLLQTVVRVLVMLAQHGVQVFAVTHNYAFLRELDFLKEETALRYFALEKTDEKGVIPYPCDSYQDLSPNRIADEYRRLYDLEIMRSLGGGGEG